MALRSVAVLAIGVMLLAATPLAAQDKLVVDIWGGNFRDGANEAIAKEFTKRTGMQVEFITGGTIDRLTKAKINRNHPESDVTVTTSHVGALYVAEGLFEKLDMTKLPNAKDLFPVAIRSPYHIGLYSYVYTPAFRTDLMPAGYDIKSWKDSLGTGSKGQARPAGFRPEPHHHRLGAARRRQRRELEGWHTAPRAAEALDQGLLPVRRHQPGSHEIRRNAGAGVAVD